jgi:hypothetical protein
VDYNRSYQGFGGDSLVEKGSPNRLDSHWKIQNKLEIVNAKEEVIQRNKGLSERNASFLIVGC